MSVYYIDILNGNDENCGTNENSPKKDYRKIKLCPGDSMLFKRGSFIRGEIDAVSGESGLPVTYGAYGEGGRPVFCGSIDFTCEENWEEIKNGVWLYKGHVSSEACNFIFNNGESCGALKWSLEELTQQGDFFDDCFGMGNNVDKKYHIYLKSEKNPAKYYNHIECVTNEKKIAAGVGHDIIYENLSFENWMFGIAGLEGGINFTVKNCSFKFIGGGVWDKNLKIQYGNAVEFWDVCENVTVTECYFEDIYDSAVTHQGEKSTCKAPVNMHFDNNIFIKCGMGAYEGRDKMPINSSFNNNICIDAGEGFSKNGVTMPRNSEIWPQPMGHHVFLWRIDEPTQEGSLEIKNNIFYNAPYGACVYSIISPKAEKQITFEDNIYYTKSNSLLIRVNGKNYTAFSDYSDFERGCSFNQPDINALLDEWKRKYHF